MKLTWWDDDHSKILAELEDGERFMEFAGPCSVQIAATELTAIEAMDPKPEIEEPPVPENLSPAQKELREKAKATAEALRKVAEERKAEAAKAAEAAAAPAAAKPAAAPAHQAAHQGGHAGAHKP